MKDSSSLYIVKSAKKIFNNNNNKNGSVSAFKAFEDSSSPYLISSVIRFFPPNNPKNLGSSYKMDQDFWDCFERVKLAC